VAYCKNTSPIQLRHEFTKKINLSPIMQ